MSARRLMLGVVAVPGAASAVFLLAVGLGPTVTGGPPAVSLSEAVVTRAQAEAVRLLRDGADPDARTPTQGLFDDLRTVHVTPLEAAVAAPDEELLAVLLNYGAAITPENAQVLRCIAAVRGAGEGILRQLPKGPPGADACDGVTLPW